MDGLVVIHAVPLGFGIFFTTQIQASLVLVSGWDYKYGKFMDMTVHIIMVVCCAFVEFFMSCFSFPVCVECCLLSVTRISLAEWDGNVNLKFRDRRTLERV